MIPTLTLPPGSTTARSICRTKPGGRSRSPANAAARAAGGVPEGMVHASAESPRHRGGHRARRRRPVRLRPVQSRRRPRRDTRPVGFGAAPTPTPTPTRERVADGVPGERRRVAAVPLQLATGTTPSTRPSMTAAQSTRAVDPRRSNRLAVAGQRHLRGPGRDHGPGPSRLPAGTTRDAWISSAFGSPDSAGEHPLLDLGTTQVGGSSGRLLPEDPSKCGGTSAFVLVGDRLYYFFIGLAELRADARGVPLDGSVRAPDAGVATSQLADLAQSGNASGPRSASSEASRACSSASSCGSQLYG